MILLALLGIIVSLINNFSPSANGCNNPSNPTTFGPRLRCIPAIIFRSTKVKKATAIKTGTIIIKVFSIVIKISKIVILIFKEIIFFCVKKINTNFH